MYLFKSSTNAYDCIISAHGGFMAENRSFTVPEGVKLYFYSPHGASLIDPGITDFYGNMDIAEPVEVITGGQQCRNYLLSKYQGAHAGESGKEVVETYDTISKKVNVADLSRNKIFGQLMRSASLQSPNTKMIQINMEQLMGRMRGASVLTIRNRWNIVFGVPLSDALKAAKKAIPTLREFHCLFCRSSMLPDKMRDYFSQTNRPDQGVQYNYGV